MPTPAKERELKKRGADKAETILEMTCGIMAASGELAVQCQVGDALKVWMDLPPELVPSATAGGEAGVSSMLPLYMPLNG